MPEKIYEELENVYRTSEEEIRNRLQDTINDIFKQIYEGGLSLTIDPKYHITVQANDYEGDVETSTAQSISVIFAFITGIIKWPEKIVMLMMTMPSCFHLNHIRW